MKRVVTGEVEGKSVFTLVDEPEQFVGNGIEVRQVWGHDELPFPLPYAKSAPEHTGGVFPPSMGVRMTLVHFLPDREQVGQAHDAGAVGKRDDVIADRGFHQTDTVDVGWVISGELGLELDDGQVVWLEPGDMVIQGGTRHLWHNRGVVPAVAGFVSMGAARSGG